MEQYSRTHSIVETRRTGKPARWSMDGVRISRAYMGYLDSIAMRVDCFHTQAWPIGAGGTLRKNYKTLYI